MTSSSVLHDIIERAHADPDQIAAKDLDRELTYGQLMDEVAQLGAGLIARGVTEGDRVALLIPNSVDFVVAALASLWIGAVFVPLAVTDPQSRLETIVADCAPSLVLTSLPEGEAAPPSLGDSVIVDINELRDERPTPVIEGDVASRVAYMIYTSGTTGTPKGVQIDNAAFAAAVRSTAVAVGLGQATRTLCVSPFHFDGSYANLFPTLVSGGTVIIRPRDALLFPRTFFNAVSKEKVTYSGFTPSYLRLLLASPQISSLNDSALEVIALGGEAITVTDLRALWSRVPGVRVFNRYGPTETTIAVTNVELTPDTIERDTITIGRPHPGVSFYLVDEHGGVIETTNRVGELYVGGVQLMSGYWANPELTRTVMRSDVVLGETLYRTGDLVYRDETGNYVYVDRTDRVVKRSGVRISLVELSASMNKLEGVVTAACMTFDREGELGIVAFVSTDAELSALDVRRAASKLIPENMLPDRFEFVAAMPLNKSNQLDEHRLLSEAGLRPFRRPST
ncbi:MAG: amino acid adenylation domain-containing protein [Acidimicrobiales bacterium]